MMDVNHQLSKRLVNEYGADTFFVIEDLTGVSFEESNVSKRSKKQRSQLCTGIFCQLKKMLEYKAVKTGSTLLKVPADYTSQRCPKCGRIHKENRHHDIHEYIYDSCGYRSNDD